MLDKAGAVPVVKEIVSPEAVETSAEVVSTGFATVANDLGLTIENAPTHPAFISVQHLITLLSTNYRLFGLYENNKQVGFVALGPLVDGAFSLEKLAVLTDYRHRGYGAVLVRFALDYASKKEADQIVINLIDENTILKDWYRDLGFDETDVKKFPDLPFTVCYMKYDLS